MKIVLANIDYRTHSTDEGNQLQEGLSLAGWKMCGIGYDGKRDVRDILKTYDPTHVFVQDKRDLDEASPGAYRKGIGYLNLDDLRDHPCKVFAPVKDAGSCIEYQRQFIRDIGADSVVLYYHEKSACRQSKWLNDYPLVRTYHTVDIPTARQFTENKVRHRGIVTGATAKRVYPMRTLAFANHDYLGIDRHFHPGYGNGGCHTPAYLKMLSSYRIHLATASRYGFALRKIIESVAVGCTPVTDLPEYDVLPEIDGALVRFDRNAGLGNLQRVLEEADEQWDYQQRMEWAEKARWYDWRLEGQRLSEKLCLLK